MELFNPIKRLIEKVKTKKLPDPTLYSSENLYDDFMEKPEIKKILDDMPLNLSKMEKAYYVYLELAKLLSENPNFCYVDFSDRLAKYNDRVDEEYYGICKSMSELYVRILRDDRIGIIANTIMQTQNSPIAHVDVIFNVEGKNYISNIIGDLTRAQGNSRTHQFCFDLRAPVANPLAVEGRARYLKRIEAKYGRLDCLSREQIEQMDLKLGYSLSVKQAKGLYTDDTIETLKSEFQNPELLKTYVIKNQDLSDDDLKNGDFLKQKLDYIFENLDKIVEHNKVMNYQERTRLLMYIAKKLLPPDECKRINAYVVVDSDEYKNLISVIKVKPKQRSGNGNANVYYLYSNEEKKYLNKSLQELREYFNGLNQDKLKIVGKFDGKEVCDLDELEL